MSCRVVCFSGPDGARMRDVARETADSLGFTLVDEAIILRAAAEAGVEPRVVADVEKRRTFMERALGALASSSDATSFMFAAGAGGYLEPEVRVSDELRGLIRTAIEETAERGDAVIVAHAASHALASDPTALRVLVTASPPTRCKRVASEQDLSEKDASNAVAQSDANRADYLKRFYGEKDELPTHYDVVVNTDRLTPAEAATLVTAAARR
jgi:Cytidylate kinase-like family